MSQVSAMESTRRKAEGICPADHVSMPRITDGLLGDTTQVAAIRADGILLQRPS